MAEEKKTETVDTAPKAAKEEKKKDAKSSKPGLGAKIKKFFKDYKSEMKKVVWPSKKQIINNTVVVAVVVVVAAVLIMVLDAVFGFGLNQLLKGV